MKNFAKRISALVLAVVVSAAVLCPAAFAAQLPSCPACPRASVWWTMPVC